MINNHCCISSLVIRAYLIAFDRSVHEFRVYPLSLILEFPPLNGLLSTLKLLPVHPE